MIYPYQCTSCNLSFDVIKSAKFYKTLEYCPDCNSKGQRVFTPPQISVDKTQPEYNPAFGKVIKNKRHRKYEADKRGMIEVGNEKPDILQKDADNTLEHKKNKRWDDALKEI